MASFAAPGGAYHYRRHKKWGARQEVEWRKKVKDYCGAGVVYQRRKKIRIEVFENSEEPPHNRWSRITVGERWNGRGEAVDEYLSLLSISPEARARELFIRSSTDVVLFRLVLREDRRENREELQYHFRISIAMNGGTEMQDVFYSEYNKRKGSYLLTNDCMTEETREECWQSLLVMCEAIVANLTIQLRSWERSRLTMLQSVIVEVENAYAFNSGLLQEDRGRFSVGWTLTVEPLAELRWATCISVHCTMDDKALNCGTAHPIGARDQMRNILDNLATSARVSTAGLRRIIDAGDIE